MTKIHISLLSNKPDKSARCLKRDYASKNFIKSVFIHESQIDDFESAFEEESITNVLIIPHTIKSTANFTPFGAFRFEHMEALRGMMEHRDMAVILDDDAKGRARLSIGQKTASGGYSFRATNLSIDGISEELIKLGKKARENNFLFFTTSMNAQGNSGFNPKSPYKAVWNYCGFLGFFKDSPNPFDAKFGGDADWDAPARLVKDRNTLSILRHEGLVIDFGFESSAYINPTTVKGKQRLKAIKIIEKRYPGITRRSDTNKTGVPLVRINRKLEIELKNTVDKKFR